MDETRRHQPGPASEPPDRPESTDGARPRPAEPAVPSSSALAGMGIQLLIAILLGLFAGRWLDTRLGTSPLLLVLGVLLGAGASMWAMYRKVFPASR